MANPTDKEIRTHMAAMLPSARMDDAGTGNALYSKWTLVFSTAFALEEISTAAVPNRYFDIADQILDAAEGPICPEISGG